ncbi:conserved hypothetical protein; putative signal peptide [Methylorubrum populi BJ001]|uniref:Uncharacterized protein n=1 Tax=Methylorubrum populi (strain ATCC BAA-705 / NCIMB 13946 / BJ001) TaxID=441620 RepID=B1ZES0_METPB|nr:hypothetical protein [Methylorubrum populi]ACB82449.1 conserved hypothetical protein; putative signal peptide [Methylorubrum populi BJ001]
MYENKLAAIFVSCTMGCVMEAGSSAAADLRPEIAPLAAAAAPAFFLFSDTQVSYFYIANGREPGVTGGKAGASVDGRPIPKQVLNISHADAWALGTNFFSLDILNSGSQDPAGTGAPRFELFDHGATEAYGIYRGTIGGNEAFNTKLFTISGAIKDISLGYGFDLSTKNTQFGPETRKLLAGAVFSFDVPAGFMNLGIYVQKEWNRNGFVTEPFRSVVFDAVPHFELVYNFPLTFTGLPLSIAGFNNINLPKGRDGFGSQTAHEFLSRTNLVLDVGKLVWDRPNRLDAFIGFQYWRNKFGNDQRFVPGSEEKTFLAGISVHVF